MRNIYLITFLVCIQLSLFGQFQIEGTILDASNFPLIGAAVIIEGTNKGTATDLNGNFTINNLSPGAYSVKTNYVGYKDQTKKIVIIDKNETVNFQLQEDTETLDEVVVVGYGVQRKREVSASIEQVSGAKIMETITPSFESALQGQAAGVNIIQGSGLAGSGSVVRIRGISSISAGAEPLYVIDGIPMDANYFLAEANWQNGAFNNNPLAALNPADIESIDILKDAAAAGIYGSRGTNGVILITTKRAKANKLTIDFSTRIATSDPVAKPQYLNSQEWLALRQEAWELDGNTGTVWIPNYSTATDSEEFKNKAYQDASMVNTDWWDQMVQTGLKYEANVGARFGRDGVKAYIGYTHANNESYIKGNSYLKHNVRANLDFNFSKKVQLRLSSSYNYGQNQRVRVAYTGGLGDAMSVALPIYKIYNDDGTYWRGYNPDGTKSKNELNAPNPVFGNDNFEGYTLDHRLINTAQLVITPTKKLSFVVNGGYDYYLQNNDQFEALEFNGVDGKYRSERDVRFVNNYNTNIYGTYDFIKNDNHDLKLLVGTEAQRSVTDGYNNVVYNGNGEPSVRSTVFRNEGSFDETTLENCCIDTLFNLKESFLSYFTRVNYSLNNKYYFQASGRLDGSSKFGSNNRYGFFPTVSVGWVISDEKWFNVPGMNFMKLKTSIGLLGNSGIPANQWIGTISLNGQYNGDPIRYANKLENPNLKWETTRTFDAAIETGFMNDKLQIELGFYDKLTDDALLSVALPQYYGFSNYFENVAKILNRGVETTITFFPIRNSKLNWKTSFNMAYNYNEVVSIGNYLPDAVSGGTNDIRVVEGQPVGTNYLIKFLGVDKETGRPIYEDKDGNPTFEYDEANDRQSVGDVLPDAVGGWTNNFTFGNFSLSGLLVFSTGYDVYDSSSKRQLSFLTDWNVDRRIADRWQQPGDDATYPRVALDPASHGNDKEWFNTSLWLQDGSHIRLRNLSLAYNIPQKILAKTKLQTASVSIGGTNLMTFTNFKGLDPEIARDFDNVNDRNLSPNITYLTPPQERSYSVSLNCKF